MISLSLAIVVWSNAVMLQEAKNAFKLSRSVAFRSMTQAALLLSGTTRPTRRSAWPLITTAILICTCIRATGQRVKRRDKNRVGAASQATRLLVQQARVWVTNYDLKVAIRRLDAMANGATIRYVSLSMLRYDKSGC